MELVVLVLIQAVNWPLAVLLAGRAATGRAPRSCAVTVVVLLASAAVAALDPTSTQVWARMAVAVMNSAVALLFAIYPDGQPVPRWIVVPAGVEVAVQVGNLVSGLAWEQQAWWPWHFAATWAVLLFGGQLYRYVRRSSVAEREQTRWPLAATLVMILGFVLWLIASAARAVPIEVPWLAALLLALPAPAFALGLLAPRLASIDTVLRVIVGVGTWSVVVALVAWAASGVLSGTWMVAVVTAACGVVVVPLARRLADAVAGRAADPLRVLERLGERLAASAEPGAVPGEIVEALTASLGLSFARLDAGGGLRAVSGTPPVDAVLENVDIPYRGEHIATLTVAARRGDAALTPRDRAAVAQICRQAAPALHGAEVVAELVDARARIVFAREEERKRLRRDLHDDLGPTFAGLGLSAAAVEAFSRAGDERAADAAATLVSGLHRATRQLRDVAYDLRPPVLDERGLVAAIQERIVSVGAVPIVTVTAPADRLVLPAAVESAALRVVQEAVANTRRHAAASWCTVTVGMMRGHLRVLITDDGVGIAGGARHGLGLRAMRERVAEVGGSLDLSSGQQGGTTVAATFPVPSRSGAPADESSEGANR